MAAPAKPSVLATLDQAYINITKQALSDIFAGLDVDALCNQSLQSDLRELANRLPINIPEISEVQQDLIKLLAVSEKLALAGNQLKHISSQNDMQIAGTKRELASLVEAIKVSAQDKQMISAKCSDQENLVASLTVQLHDAKQMLEQLKEQEEQVNKVHSDHEDNVRKCNDIINTAARRFDEENLELQTSIAGYKQESKILFEALKKWQGTTAQ